MRKWIPTQGYKHSNLVHQYLQTDCHLRPDVYVQQRPMSRECQTLPRLQLGRSLHMPILLYTCLDVCQSAQYPSFISTHFVPLSLPNKWAKVVWLWQQILLSSSFGPLFCQLRLPMLFMSPFSNLLKLSAAPFKPYSLHKLHEETWRQADRFQDGGSWAEALFPGAFTLREIYNYNSKLLNYSYNNVIYRIIRHVCQVVTLCYSE